MGKIKSEITAGEADFVDSETKLKTAELAAKASRNRQRASELDAEAKRAAECVNDSETTFFAF